ncbi:unnamed protein product [Phaeothamnion confervicola]
MISEPRRGGCARGRREAAQAQRGQPGGTPAPLRAAVHVCND